MAITAFTNPVSGVWPLGAIVVAAAGTTVALNINVGPHTQNPNNGEPSGNLRQLMLFAPAANTLLMYVIRKVSGQVVSKATPNFVVAIVNPGQMVTLPGGALGMGPNLNIDDYVIDADTSGGILYASGVTG